MKGRGTEDNPVNRFHDTWVEPEEGDFPERVPTRVMATRARTVIARNRSPDVPFDQSVNPYQGCEHGCIYCYARPSHAHLDLSPGLDFETRIFAKRNAADCLRRELSRPGYRCQPLAFGANTDPYQPAEKRLRITRELLQVCREFNQPVTLITKGALVERDVDLLAELASLDLASVAISVTTLDNRLKRTLEPRASGPAARLRAMQHLALAGVPVSVLVAPVIPRVNDDELEDILARAADHGARSAGYIFLRLPREVAPLFRDWLKRHLPDRADAVMSLVRQSRGGRDYDAAFGQRMSGSGPFAALIARRFEVARRRYGLDRRNITLDTQRFKVPLGSGGQPDLFAPMEAGPAGPSSPRWRLDWPGNR